jgi:ribulose-5-phosphate 4-epimerase/fuculose-1-phosphate aldolase
VDDEEVRRDCLLGARVLWRELRDVYGHVSGRLSRGGFALKMVRVPPAPLSPDEMLEFDDEGSRRAGQQEIWELPLHTEILRRRPDIVAVVHSHPHAATALSTTGKTVFAVTQQSSAFGVGLPVFPGDWIDSAELGRALAECLGDAPAALLKGHGVVTVGRSVGHAVETMLYVEQAAKQIIWASMIGTPEVLPLRLRDNPRRRQIAARGGGGSRNLWQQLVWDLETGGAGGVHQ